jgi:SAM-dependent methyltransferase
MTAGGGGAHHDRGLHRVLDLAWVYDALQESLLRPGSRAHYVREHVRPFAGCRILDIGCGKAGILAHLPESLGYVGFDMNPGYIAAARRRWGSRAEFHCSKVDEVSLQETGRYDIVLANGIVHHLDDAEADGLFGLAYAALAPGGRLITYDNVYTEDQHWFARWLIGRDRGQAVRTRPQYEALARPRFPRVESALLHDTLRVPYTILVMTCCKGGPPPS